MAKDKDNVRTELNDRLPKRDLAAKYFGQYLEGNMYNLKITRWKNVYENNYRYIPALL